MTTCIWGWGWAVDKANNNHVSHDYVDQYKIRIELHVSRQTYVANMYNVGQNYMCHLCAADPRHEYHVQYAIYIQNITEMLHF